MNGKKVRTKGKLSLSRYFQELKQGERASIKIEGAMQPAFPKRLQGKTGIVKEKRGGHYIVSIKDQDQTKSFLIHPVHLKKIKTIAK